MKTMIDCMMYGSDHYGTGLSLKLTTHAYFPILCGMLKGFSSTMESLQIGSDVYLNLGQLMTGGIYRYAQFSKSFDFVL